MYAGINGLKMFYEFRGTPVPVKVPVVVTVCPGALQHSESLPPRNRMAQVAGVRLPSPRMPRIVWLMLTLPEVLRANRCRPRPGSRGWTHPGDGWSRPKFLPWPEPISIISPGVIHGLIFEWPLSCRSLGSCDLCNERPAVGAA